MEFTPCGSQDGAVTGHLQKQTGRTNHEWPSGLNVYECKWRGVEGCVREEQRCVNYERVPIHGDSVPCTNNVVTDTDEIIFPALMRNCTAYDGVKWEPM